MMRHAVSSFLTMNLVLTRDQAQVPWLRVAEVGTVASSFVNIADIVAGDEGVIAALRDNIEEGLFEAEVISCLEIVGNSPVIYPSSQTKNKIIIMNDGSTY